MQKIQDVLNDIKKITGHELIYFTPSGEQVAGTCSAGGELARGAKDFAVSVADSQKAFGYCFLKVMVRDRLDGILLISAKSENSYLMGLMAAREIVLINESLHTDYDRSSFMQHLLLGNLLSVDVYQKAKAMKLDVAERVVFLIRVDRPKNDAMEETLRSYFDLELDDIIELDRDNYIIIKDVRDGSGEDDLGEIARAVVTVLQTEASTNACVSFGNPCQKLESLPSSYQEAKLAMEVGRIFYPKETILPYTRLGIGRLIYQLPQSLCEMFVKEVFGNDIPDEVYDEETMETIEKFLENNLNISETARQLYVHRNTLVYRLERLQSALGLDIRVFEDAMTFRIVYMVLQHLKDIREQ